MNGLHLSEVAHVVLVGSGRTIGDAIIFEDLLAKGAAQEVRHLSDRFLLEVAESLEVEGGGEDEYLLVFVAPGPDQETYYFHYLNYRIHQA